MAAFLFSYGTLQQDKVQLANFGRLLSGKVDTLPGFIIDFVEITDPLVLAQSEKALHPILRRSDIVEDVVEGTVFEISEDELAQADRYEVDDYQRVQVTLTSGTQAWVYVAR
jgi:hypothetical protein